MSVMSRLGDCVCAGKGGRVGGGGRYGEIFINPQVHV